jgi:hypothetical protein
MMRRTTLLAALGAAAVISPAIVEAQGTLSTQGFGYPTGQVSTRVRSTGGGLGQFDPDSPLNPAALATSSDPRVFLQYEPEYRRLSNGDASNNTMTARFSLASASVPFASRGSIGLSIGTFLDRSSITSFTTPRSIAGQTIDVTETTQVLGAINDVRLGLGYAPSTKIQVGVGGHVYVGQNRMFFTQAFPDTLKFSSVTQVSTLAYTGFAASVGGLLRPSRNFGIGLSARKGFGIEAKNGDSTVSEADVPDRIGAGVSYDGIPGSSISATVSRELWSSLNGLGSENATAVDTWEGGLGLETLGPRIVQRQTILRLGGRYRQLPFLAAGSEITELSFGGGIGAQFFRNRAMFDVSFERASRKPEDSSLDVSERAYIFSFGLRVRP